MSNELQTPVLKQIRRGTFLPIQKQKKEATRYQAIPNIESGMTSIRSSPLYNLNHGNAGGDSETAVQQYQQAAIMQY